MTRVEQSEDPTQKLKDDIKGVLLKKGMTEAEANEKIAEREHAWTREPGHKLKPEHRITMEEIFWENVLHDFKRIGFGPPPGKDVFRSPQGEGFEQNEDFV